MSWAVPKGMMGAKIACCLGLMRLGIERGESRLAVETTIHPVSYAVYEGSETAGRGTREYGRQE